MQGVVGCRRSIDELDKRFLLLLTGTPIQNNMSELYSMMNLVDPERFDCCDTFLDLYGNPPSRPSTPEQLTALQVRAPVRPLSAPAAALALHASQRPDREASCIVYGWSE